MAVELIVGDLMAHDTHYDHMHVVGFWEASICYGVGCAGTCFCVVTAPEE